MVGARIGQITFICLESLDTEILISRYPGYQYLGVAHEVSSEISGPKRQSFTEARLLSLSQMR